MTMTKVLQIIHVSDLHVGMEVSDETRHLREKNSGALMLTRFLSNQDAFGWSEGTQVHYPTAPDAFDAFIEDLRAADGEWFEVPTWLLDTGDLTTFGDDKSIQGGKGFLSQWAGSAGNAQTRTLYGNHDAWPECQPFTRLGSYFDDLCQQYGKLTAHPDWRWQQWLWAPLQAPIPSRGIPSNIVLYGLDTVGWSGARNGRAVGEVDQRVISALQEAIEGSQAKGRTRDLRILATHHPISFPYQGGDVQVLGLAWPDKMRLANAPLVARRLGGQPDPFVHLMIAGHAHARYPGGPLNVSANAIAQLSLGGRQLQLVGSSLMLNRSVRSGAGPMASISVNVEGFDPAVLDPHMCQADILRFSIDAGHAADEKTPSTLLLERIPVVSILGDEYRLVPSQAQAITIEF